MHNRRTKIDQGNWGEQYAVEFLTSLGFEIIERNFRIRGNKIATIAIEIDPRTEEKTLVFLEVKTRSSRDYGTPLEAIG